VGVWDSGWHLFGFATQENPLKAVYGGGLREKFHFEFMDDDNLRTGIMMMGVRVMRMRRDDDDVEKWDGKFSLIYYFFTSVEERKRK